MKRLLLLFALAATALLQGAVPIPILLVSNSDSPQEAGAFRDAGWELTLRKVKDFAAASDTWSRYPVILVGDGAVRALAGAADAWRAYLESGGVLVVSSYDPKLLAAAAEIIPGSTLASSYCVIAADKAMKLDNRFSAHSALLFPNRVIEHFTRRPGGWAQCHLACSGDWEILAACPEGDPLLAGQPVGKGYLAVTAFVGLGGPVDRRENASRLLQNLLAHNQLRQTELAVERLNWPMAYDNADLALALRNTAATSRQIAGTLTLTQPDGTEAVYPFAGEVPAAGLLEWSDRCAAATEGALALEIALTEPVAAGWRAERAIAAPARFYAASPRLYPGQAADARFRLETAPAVADEGKYLIECLIDGEVYDTYRIVNADTVSLDLSALAPGRHTTGVRVLKLPEVRGFMTDIIVYEKDTGEFEVIPEAPAVHIDNDGFMNVRGGRVLPLGLYTVSWSNSASRDALLDYCIDAGFNLIHVSYNGQVDEFSAFVERAREHGVMLIVEGVGYNAVQQLKKYDNIVAWNVGDEPDLGARPVAEVMPLRRELMHADPGRPEYTVIVSAEAFREYRPIADIIGCDYYPFNFPGALETVGETFERLHADLTGGPLMPFAIPWCYGYSAGDMPTPAQLRSQIYQALCGGATGLCLYAWNDGRPYEMRDFPAVIEAARKLPPELRTIEEFLLHGTRAKLAEYPALSGRYATRWTLPDESTLVILINAARDETFTFDLAGAFPELEELFATSPRRFAAGDRLQLELGPLEVVVLKSER